MPVRTNNSRRDFLKSSAVAGAAALSGGVFSEVVADDSNSPNQKLNIACIGTANRAAADVAGVKGENIVALCDIDSVYLDRAKGQFPEARAYADGRELLEAEAKKIDAVVVATADHTHAPFSIRAIRKGLHVYCEKPLTHTIEEARLVAEAAAEHKVATQLGTQIHAGANYRRVVEIIKSGAIGDVTEAHVWVGKGWGGGERPVGEETPPSTLSWDLWLGPAPVRPFAAGRYHPAQWRRWWDFGQGTLGDMACHYMDLPFRALKLRHPTHCEAEGPEVHPETCPLGLTVRYKFPEREDGLPPVDLTWYDGDMVPKEVEGQRVPNSGVMFVGSKGMMFANYGSYKFFPAEDFVGFKPPEKSIPDSVGHHAEWIKACKDGTPTTCNFDYSGTPNRIRAAGQRRLSHWKIARVGKTLKATNCEEADKYIRKEYREGWEVA